MSHWVINYIACVIISILMSGLIIPKIILIAFRRQLFDGVDERKIHHGSVPRLGGISFTPSAMFSLCLVVGVNFELGRVAVTNLLVLDIVPVYFLISSMMLMYLVGMCDDLIGVRYRAKFLFQTICGVLIICSGLWIHDLYGFLWIDEIPFWIGWLLSILLIIYVTNAINLIDGIDGLASGISMISLIFYSYVLVIVGEFVYALIAGAFLGTLIPFFYYNVFGNAEKHKKIFMGDTGSLTIGFVLSFIALTVMNVNSEAVIGGKNLVVLAIAPILLPCLDVVRVFIHRIRRGRNPFMPDKCHIHHKLLALGFPQRKALVAILVSEALMIAMNLCLSPVIGSTWLILGDLVGWTLINMLLTHLIRQREKKLEIILYE